MRKKVQPKLSKISIACACGHTIHAMATGSDYTVEICSQCHPFFTGKQKFIDTAGKIDKFNKKYANFKKPAKPVAQTTA